MTDGTEKAPLSVRLNTALGRHRTAIIVVSAAIVVIIISSVIAFNLSQRRMERSIAAAEEIQLLYEEWSAANDAGTDGPDAAAEPGGQPGTTDTTEETLRTKIDAVVEGHPRGYAATRARFVLAQVEWERGDFEAAHAAFLAVAEGDAESYLAPIALFNAAAALEETGDVEGAIELYRRVAGSTVPNVEAPRALFALGRLSEGQGDREGAIEYYNRLIDEHGGSNWTNLGRNRIIWLNSQEG